MFQLKDAYEMLGQRENGFTTKQSFHNRCDKRGHCSI